MGVLYELLDRAILRKEKSVLTSSSKNKKSSNNESNDENEEELKRLYFEAFVCSALFVTLESEESAEIDPKVVVMHRILNSGEEIIESTDKTLRNSGKKYIKAAVVKDAMKELQEKGYGSFKRVENGKRGSATYEFKLIDDWKEWTDAEKVSNHNKFMEILGLNNQHYILTASSVS